MAINLTLVDREKPPKKREEFSTIILEYVIPLNSPGAKSVILSIPLPVLSIFHNIATAS